MEIPWHEVLRTFYCCRWHQIVTRSVSSTEMGSGCYSLRLSASIRVGATGRMFVKFDTGCFMKICPVKFGSYRALYMMARVCVIVAGHINPLVTSGTYWPQHHYFLVRWGRGGPSSPFCLLPWTFYTLWKHTAYQLWSMLPVSQCFRPNSCVYYSCSVEWCLRDILVWETLRASFEFYSVK
jgi:hypothetical protein